MHFQISRALENESMLLYGLIMQIHFYYGDIIMCNKTDDLINPSSI